MGGYRRSGRTNRKTGGCEFMTCVFGSSKYSRWRDAGKSCHSSILAAGHRLASQTFLRCHGENRRVVFNLSFHPRNRIPKTAVDTKRDARSGTDIDRQSVGRIGYTTSHRRSRPNHSLISSIQKPALPACNGCLIENAEMMDDDVVLDWEMDAPLKDEEYGVGAQR